MDSTAKVVQGLFKIFVMMVLAIIIVSTAFLSGFGAGFSLAPTRPSPVAAAGEEPSDFAVFWEAWHLIESEFYGELPPMQEVTYGAIRGVLVAVGDDGTSFIDPERAAVMREDITGGFEGIGAVVNMLPNGRLIIVEPLPGRPAAQAGIQQGDLVLQVDDTPIQNMTLIEAVSLIRGPAGSTVRLTILRKGVREPFEVAIVRQRIEIEVVESRMLDDDIAYVRLTEFNAKATKELKEALRDLLAEGVVGDVQSVWIIRGSKLDGTSVLKQQASALTNGGGCLMDYGSHGLAGVWAVLGQKYCYESVQAVDDLSWCEVLFAHKKFPIPCLRLDVRRLRFDVVPIRFCISIVKLKTSNFKLQTSNVKRLYPNSSTCTWSFV